MQLPVSLGFCSLYCIYHLHLMTESFWLHLFIPKKRGVVPERLMYFFLFPIYTGEWSHPFRWVQEECSWYNPAQYPLIIPGLPFM